MLSILGALFGPLGPSMILEDPLQPLRTTWDPWKYLRTLEVHMGPLRELWYPWGHYRTREDSMGLLKTIAYKKHTVRRQNNPFWPIFFIWSEPRAASARQNISFIRPECFHHHIITILLVAKNNIYVWSWASMIVSQTGIIRIRSISLILAILPKVDMDFLHRCWRHFDLTSFL